MRYLRTFESISFLVVCMAVIAGARSVQAKNETTIRRRLASSSFLYNNAEDTLPVIEYKARNTSQVDPKHPDFVLIEHKGPHVVEFYSPMCGHCRNFRNRYIEVARQTTNIAQSRMRAAANSPNAAADDDNSMVKFYAVSCTAYNRICRHFKITRYPTVRLFPGGQEKNESQYIKVNYGQLQPFDILLKLGIQSSGGELSGGITSNTTLLVPPPIARLAAADSGEMANAADASSASSSSAWTATFDRQMIKKNDVYADMYRSFHFSLKYEIYAANEPLAPDSRNALLQWLRLLQMTIPPLWSELHNLLSALQKDFDSIVQEEEHLAKVLDRFPPIDMKWSETCSHGEKGRGFTCGLWKLFHLMTVGVVEWNSLLVAKNGSSMKISPVEASTTLRNFIQHFFRCEVCRSEFVQTFDSCQQNHCHALFASTTTNKAKKDPSFTMADWIQLPIWLFETHNAVTRRLLHEKAELEDWKQPVSRQDELNHEWPSRAECPRCWRPSAANEAESEKTMSLFDQDHVYKFLRLEYWPEDDIASEYRNQLLSGVKSSQSLRKTEGNRNINIGTDRFSLWLPVYLAFFLAIAWYSKLKVSRTKVKH